MANCNQLTQLPFNGLMSSTVSRQKEVGPRIGAARWGRQSIQFVPVE